jgi:hypothetical protein
VLKGKSKDLAQVDGEGDLPPIWEELRAPAGARASDEKNGAPVKNDAPGRHPRVGGHHRKIVKLAFVSPNEDQLERGLQLFVTLYANAKTVSELTARLLSWTALGARN